MKRGVLLLIMLLVVATQGAPEPARQVTIGKAAPLDRLERLERGDGVACPSTLDCAWMPATFGPVPGRPGEYKFAPADRPGQPRIKYIVIHGTESSYESTIDAAQNPREPNSWHFSIRSHDGRIAQHLSLRDIGWHTGNHYVSWQAIGIEHEGYANRPGWYTEAMYRASATLVRHLAKHLRIPLDRQHILGHDNVGGMTPQWIRRMHTDPGPYWDWEHYFDLLGAPLDSGEGGENNGDSVTIAPDFGTNRPAFTGCGSPSGPCPTHGSSAVLLRSAPDANAPLVNDSGLRTDGAPSTTRISDQGAHASAGQRFVRADLLGDWTAIWYLGQKAWFHNPAAAPTALPASGLTATPKPGRPAIPVYGWALPDRPVVLPYTLSAGQSYAVGEITAGFEFVMTTDATGARTGEWTARTGGASYAQIQFGHRIMFVDLDDVDIRSS